MKYWDKLIGCFWLAVSLGICGVFFYFFADRVTNIVANFAFETQAVKKTLKGLKLLLIFLMALGTTLRLSLLSFRKATGSITVNNTSNSLPIESGY